MSNPITEMIESAWEDEAEADEATETEGSVASEQVTQSDDQEGLDEDATDEAEESDAEEEEDTSDDEEGEDEEESSDEEDDGDETPGAESDADTYSSDDPQVVALLEKYGGLDEALKASARFDQVLGRQGRELGLQRDRIAELESELEQVQAFAQSGNMIMDEAQRNWVDEALSSEQPLQYIQSAVQAGEFDLARAVLEQVEMPTFQAMRMAQAIDQAEARTVPMPEESGPLDHQALLGVLVDFYPDMPKFESEMVSTLAALGHDHPLAVMSRAQDPEVAAQGIIGVYEIARAKTATVASTRAADKSKRRQAGDAARRSAVVTSAQATPIQSQAARREKTIMPGLTLESLEAEFGTE
jgi:hypothetical protein